LGKIATGFRAKTAIFVPELNRYFLAVLVTAAERLKSEFMSRRP